MKKPTLTELLEQNPDVDRELLKESLRLAEKLREAGFEGARYRLATPTSKARASEYAKRNGAGHAHHLVQRH
jgi:hypothetical protein